MVEKRTKAIMASLFTVITILLLGLVISFFTAFGASLPGESDTFVKVMFFGIIVTISFTITFGRLVYNFLSKQVKEKENMILRIIDIITIIIIGAMSGFMIGSFISTILSSLIENSFGFEIGRIIYKISAIPFVLVFSVLFSFIGYKIIRSIKSKIYSQN